MLTEGEASASPGLAYPSCPRVQGMFLCSLLACMQLPGPFACRFAELSLLQSLPWPCRDVLRVLVAASQLPSSPAELSRALPAWAGKPGAHWPKLKHSLALANLCPFPVTLSNTPAPCQATSLDTGAQWLGGALGAEPGFLRAPV